MVTESKVIEQIRESRIRMSEECNHSPEKYVDMLKKMNRKYFTQVKRFQERQKGVITNISSKR